MRTKKQSGYQANILQLLHAGSGFIPVMSGYL